MKKKYIFPLAMFLLPTMITSALMWPTGAMQVQPIAGFVIMLGSFAATYLYGIRLVLEDQKEEDGVSS